MILRSSALRWLAAGLLPFAFACSGKDNPSAPIVYGGATQTSGGAGTEGGSQSNGGTNAGGSTSGGESSGGTATSTGGAAMGGDSASGGLLGSGGVSDGGASPVGGVTNTGGKATSGGATSGGTASGGAASGGTASGGAASGGATSGGATSGGATSGGATSGGATSGGAASGGSSGCTTACLVHRYTFDGTGTTVTDSVGTANGAVVNATLGSGTVVLGGGTTDQYVDLPADVLTGLSGATFEVWVTWTGGAAWQRIFDFGSNDGATAGSQGTGQTYLFLSPKAVSNTGKLRVAYTVAGNSMETLIDAPAALPANTLTHLAVVVDSAASTLALYQDGASVGSAALATSMSAITSTNNWLGRSQYLPDPEFAGTIHEFRIYGGARTSAQIQASFTAGPDTAPTQ